MSRGWLAESLWLTLCLSGGLVIGLVLDAPAPTLLLALALWLLVRGRDLLRFEAWLAGAIARPPRLSGIVEDFAYRILRQRRRARRRTRRLARLLRQLQRSTDALPDAAVLLEGHDSIVWFNRAAGELLGLQRRDLGHGLGALLRQPALQQLLHGDRATEFVEIASPVDEHTTLDLRLIPFGEQQQLLMARDVTPITRLRNMRQDFIANVSHELRTPLTVVLGYLEALDEETDADTLRATLGRLRRPATRMKTLVEDLLLLSRLDSGDPVEPRELGSIDVAAMLRRILADAEALSDGAHRFETDIDPTLRLQGMDQELHSAFANLITNAVRYSPGGGAVRVSWQAGPDGGARFAVTDEGLGVAAEHLPRLTERFYRVDVGRSREAGGTGLGLAIVKHVLRRHESELEIDSEPGHGSTFACAFPASIVSRSDPERSAGAASAP